MISRIFKALKGKKKEIEDNNDLHTKEDNVKAQEVNKKPSDRYKGLLDNESITTVLDNFNDFK